MSLWLIERRGDKSVLIHTDNTLLPSPLIQKCGEIDSVAESDLEAWVFDQAKPFDRIVTPAGMFVRQTMTTKNRLATA